MGQFKAFLKRMEKPLRQQTFNEENTFRVLNFLARITLEANIQQMLWVLAFVTFTSFLRCFPDSAWRDCRQDEVKEKNNHLLF